MSMHDIILFLYGFILGALRPWIFKYFTRPRKVVTMIKYPLITKNDIKQIKLRMNDPYRLAYWSCELNSWKWPPELYPEESPQTYIYNGRRSQLRQYLKDLVGAKKISFFWNTEYRNGIRMTPDEFEKWWAENRDE